MTWGNATSHREEEESLIEWIAWTMQERTPSSHCKVSLLSAGGGSDARKGVSEVGIRLTVAHTAGFGGWRDRASAPR